MNRHFKGALHIHTTVSDGRKSPEETLEAYKSAGYDFVALTDHWIYGEAGEYKGMQILSGIEYDTGNSIVDGIFHIVGIGMERKPSLERVDLNNYTSSVERAQHIINCINDAGGAAILAHPAWSINRPSDILKLHGLAGVEIYNGVSGYPFGNRANSAVILDILAADDYFLPVHAADDTHFWEGEECSSFVLTTESNFSSSKRRQPLCLTWSTVGDKAGWQYTPHRMFTCKRNYYSDRLCLGQWTYFIWRWDYLTGLYH